MTPARLLASTALLTFLLAPAARAQDQSARLVSIEKQIQALQAELARVKRDLRASQAEVRTTRQARTAAPAGARPATAPAAAPQPPEPTLAAQPDDISRAAPPQRQVGSKPGDNPGGVSFPNGRPTLTSQDGRFSAAVGLQLHYDVGGSFAGTNNAAQPSRLNSFGQNLRRARLPFVFKYDDFQINLTPDFGGSPDGAPTLYEANINYALHGTPLVLTLGYYKPDFTLGDSTSSNAFLFLERPSIVETSRNIAAGDSRSVVGGRWAANRFFVDAYLSGAPYGSQQAALAQPQQTGGLVRVAGRPVASENTDVHLGFSASSAFRIQRTATGQTLNVQDRPELRIDQNRLVSTGALNARSAYTYGPEFAVRYRNFLLQGEYIRIGVDRAQGSSPGPAPALEFDGYYVEGSWVLSGEPRRYTVANASFNNPKVAHPLQEGGLGAFELVARYSHINLDDKVTRGIAQSVTGGVFGGKQDVYAVGLNWLPNDYLRLMLDYDIVNVDRLNAAGTTQIGRRFQEVGLRAQAAF